MALENLLLDRKLNAAVTPSGWPVEGGWVSSGFGRRADPFTGHQSMHEGMDIATRYGSSIQAMGDGLVTFSGDKAGYGLMVEITHDSALVTRYAHTSGALVKVGDRGRRDKRLRWSAPPAAAPARTCTSSCCATVIRSIRCATCNRRATSRKPAPKLQVPRFFLHNLPSLNSRLSPGKTYSC